MEEREYYKQIREMIGRYTVIGRFFLKLKNILNLIKKICINIIKCLFKLLIIVIALLLIYFISIHMIRGIVVMGIISVIEIIIFILPIIMIIKNTKKLKKKMQAESDVISYENFSDFINGIRAAVIFSFPWYIELPVTIYKEKVSNYFKNYALSHYAKEFEISTFEDSKKYIEKLMDEADKTKFTDDLKKKPDDQEYFCFENSFLEYVDAFSPVLEIHHELYIKDYIGDKQSEKDSK